MAPRPISGDRAFRVVISQGLSGLKNRSEKATRYQNKDFTILE
jgi:hypothetical protein